MCINELSKVICHEGCEDSNTQITIYMHHDKERHVELWKGKAKDLKDQKYLSDFMVVEMI